MQMCTKATILIVEDETDVLRANARMMTRRGYAVTTAATVSESLQCMENGIPDLLILDVMLPDGSGYDICECFRRKSDNPVIFLSGKSEIGDRIEGLVRGGDYYLTKPYNFDELLAVAERLLKRHFKIKETHEQLERITKGALTLDISKAKAFVGGKDANLTSTEFAMLMLLVKNEETVFSPRELYEAVWGTPSVNDTRTIRFHIGNLKKKIDTENSADYDIVSVYGRGYCFTTK